MQSACPFRAEADISFAIGSADRYPGASSAAKAERGCLAPQEPLVSAVLLAEQIVELARLRDFHQVSHFLISAPTLGRSQAKSLSRQTRGA
jgi:hypothetical protein